MPKPITDDEKGQIVAQIRRIREFSQSILQSVQEIEEDVEAGGWKNVADGLCDLPDDCTGITDVVEQTLGIGDLAEYSL